MFCMTREYEKFYQIRSIPFFRHDFSRKGTLNPSNFLRVVFYVIKNTQMVSFVLFFFFHACLKRSARFSAKTVLKSHNRASFVEISIKVYS